jgi:uncharacterized protein
MKQGSIVIDAVVHPYNLSPSNWIEGGQQLMEAVHSFHQLFTKDPATWLTREEYFTDFPSYATAHALFAESDCDMAILHALPILGFTSGVLTDRYKMAALRDRYPDRFVLYGNADTLDIHEAIKQLELQVKELHIVGLKFYPALFYDTGVQRWRMDDPNYAIPLLEAARDLGVRNVAIHKAMPWGAPVDYYKIGDMEDPIGRFPDMNFQMVHAGFAFLEETVMYLRSYKNFYANLEATAAFADSRPRYFAEVLGEMLYWGCEDQILFASGLNVAHPRPVLDALESIEMPKDLMEGKGYPAITPEVRRKIMGLNAARMHGIDPVKQLAKIKDDEFEQAKKGGLRAPWSGVREHAETVAVS